MADMTLKEKIARIRLVADGLRGIQEFESARYLDEYGDHLAGMGEPVAWLTADGRVITAQQKTGAVNDGGACASSVAPYVVPAYTAPPASADVASLQSRLAAADALLRDIKDWDVNQAQGTCLMVPHNLRKRIQAHLSENTHG